MIERVGVVGVGHLAGYLVEGLRRASANVEIILSPRNAERSATLAARFGATVATGNQAIADAVDLVLLCTRPADTVPVAEAMTFRPGQIVVSVAVGLPLERLTQAVAPATAIRALPISCAAINRSPTLLYPDHPAARALFDLLGQVHVLADESQFTPASVIGAYYGWVYALLDETVAWTAQAGVPPEIARRLVLETVRGAVDMASAEPDRDIADMLDTLATPGGTTEHGLEILHRRGGLSAWVEALQSVLTRLQGED